MQKRQRDAVRQALETALKNLQDDSSEGDIKSDSVSLIDERRLSSGSPSSEAPIVIVIADDLNSRSHDRSPANPGDTKEPENVNACPSNHSERKVSHPGLERFTMVEAGSNSTVPRACFMEPNRVCVNSGACEMRGF
jgi:hypothetical protein